MKTNWDQKQIFAEPYGLRVSVPREGFTEGSLAVLRQMLRSKELLIRKALGADSLDFVLTKNTVLFPWFFEVPDQTDIDPILQFISALCARAKSGKPAPQLRNFESERYTFNNFLTALDLSGPEYQQLRRQLMRNLSGSVPFPDRKAELRYKEQQHRKRQEESAIRFPSCEDTKWIPE